MKAALAALLLLAASSAGAQAAWEPLGTRWAVQRDDAGRATEIDDLSYPGVLGRVVLGEVGGAPAPRDAAAAAGSWPSAVPAQWWREIPWKARMTGAPASFALSDIDFARAARDPRRFAELTGRWDRGVFPRFLDRFRVRALPGGRFELSWEPGDAEAAGTDLAGPPLLTVKLLSPKANLWDTLAYQGLEDGVGEIISLISVPVVSALLGTAVDRFFHWTDLLSLTRKDSLTELLADAPPGFGLGDAERARAAQGLLYAETPLLLSPEWLWLKPGRQWQARLAGEASRSALRRGWLQAAGVAARPLSRDLDFAPSSGRAYLSGENLLFDLARPEPTLALDPSDPGRIVRARLAVDAAVTAADFGSTWVPYVGGLGVDGLKLLIETPQDNLRRWETRLAVRLEEREARLGEDWEPELEQLIRQQTNPFEISRAQTLELVARRRAELGIAPSPR